MSSLVDCIFHLITVAFHWSHFGFSLRDRDVMCTKHKQIISQTLNASKNSFRANQSWLTRWYKRKYKRKWQIFLLIDIDPHIDIIYLQTQSYRRVNAKIMNKQTISLYDWTIANSYRISRSSCCHFYYAAITIYGSCEQRTCIILYFIIYS